MLRKKPIALAFLLALNLSACGGDSNTAPSITVSQSSLNVLGREEVVITPTMSDADGDNVTLSFSSTSSSTRYSLDIKQQNGTLTFKAPDVDSPTNFIIVLTASDGQATTETSVSVNVGVALPYPVAKAYHKGDISAALRFSAPEPHNIAILKSTGSVGVNATWSVSSAPLGSNSAFTHPASPTTGFYADKAGSYVIQLTMDNANKEAESVRVTLTVNDDVDGDGLLDKDDADVDGDGYTNEEDAYPLDKASHRDSDGDGVSNYAQHDEDDDGVLDHVDDYPFDPNKTERPLVVEPAENNSNDGISVATSAGSVPVNIEGELLGIDGYDQDYFQIALLEPGRITIDATFSGGSKPIMSVVNHQGQVVPFIDLPSFSAERTQISAVIPAQGDYYIALANNYDGKSNINYAFSVFYDKDQDGVSDDTEIALDSNELNADSDGDGILDGIEISAMFNQIGEDQDNDGLPNWWDLDSDGDNITDRIESGGAFTIDVDADMALNFLDLDSDGNGVSDDIEYGDIYDIPLDTNQNGIPDYLDLDNDGDGIPDADDLSMNEYNTASNVTDPSEIKLSIAAILQADEQPSQQCLIGDTMTIKTENALPSGAVKLFAQSDRGPINIPVVSASGNEIRFECVSGLTGLRPYILVAGEQRSDDFGIETLPQNQLILSSAYVDGNRLYITGRNLNQLLTVHFDTLTLPVDNRAGSADTLDVNIPASASGRNVFISSDQGSTDPITLTLPAQFSTLLNLTLPQGIDFDEVLLSDLHGDVTISGSSVTYIGRRNEVSIAQILLSQDGTLYPLIFAPVLPGDTQVLADATSTALGTLWLLIPMDWSAADAANHRNQLLSLPAVVALGEFIFQQIALDATYLSKLDLYDTSAYLDALTAAQAYANSINPATAIAQGDIAPVIKPNSEIDDISITFSPRQDTSGLWAIENDTMLYLAFSVVDKDGTQLCALPTGYFSPDHVSPQSGWPLYYAYSSAAQCMGANNMRVRILTAGIDVQHEPEVTGISLSAQERAVISTLKTRTMIDGLAVPLIQGILNIADLKLLSNKELSAVLSTHAPLITSELMESAVGEQSFEQLADDFLRLIYLDALSGGPIVTSVKTLLSKLYPNLSLKIATQFAKLPTYAVPVIGQVKMVAKGLQSGGDFVTVAKTGVDYMSVDAAIDFDIEFPLQVESVSPYLVNTDLTTKTFHIYGQGFKPTETLFGSEDPVVVITNSVTQETLNLPPKFISSFGDQITVDAPGWFFKEHGTTYSIQVVLPGENMLGSNVLDPAITVDDILRITDIAPKAISPNSVITIKGNGFDPLPSNNTVMFGNTLLSVLAVDQNGLLVRLPMMIDPGTYDITVTVGDNTSNAFPVVVAAANIAIRVCDNGGQKDDNFALDVNTVRIGQTSTTRYNYCFTFPVSLVSGEHTAVLTGLDAPDGIGTYSIDFYGATFTGGAALKGEDLTPGSAPKVFRFRVDPTGAATVHVVPMQLPAISASTEDN